MQRLAKAIAWPLAFCAITGYFLWNTMHGPHGLDVYGQREMQLRQAKADLTAAQAKRNHWTLLVSALSDNSLSLGMLDERARAMLDLARPGDIILRLPRQDRLF